MNQIAKIKSHIRTVPDFPKPGIQFLDVNPIFSSPELFQDLISEMATTYDWSQIDTLIGIESRGFILASALATYLKKGFVPCRKAGKLPPPVIQQSYTLEYGSATLELSRSSEKKRAIVVDDVLATGGTLMAACSLAHEAGYEVMGSLVLINIAFLNNWNLSDKKIKALINV